MKSTKIYSCTKKLLYSICTTCWNSCSNYVTDFTSFKAFYTPQFISTQLQAIEDAKALPDSRQIIAARRNARVNLIAAADIVKSNWQNLKVYITKAYSKDLAPAMLDAAGADLYRKVSANNWGAITALIDAANTVIADNLADLTANNNMPETFQATFQTAGENCIGLATTFFEADNAKKFVVQNKLAANNAIYESTIEMLKDGQQIFKDNAAVKPFFVFSEQAAVQEGKNTASVYGYIKNDAKLPVVGATVTSKELGYSAITNEKGRYSITRMVEGDYTLTITCPGYVSQDIQVTVVAGTKTKATVTLASAMKKAA
jgi:hypothetical protein